MSPYKLLQCYWPYFCAVYYIHIAYLFYNRRFVTLNPLLLCSPPRFLPSANHLLTLCVYETIFILLCLLIHFVFLHERVYVCPLGAELLVALHLYLSRTSALLVFGSQMFWGFTFHVRTSGWEAQCGFQTPHSLGRTCTVVYSSRFVGHWTRDVDPDGTASLPFLSIICDSFLMSLVVGNLFY